MAKASGCEIPLNLNDLPRDLAHGLTEYVKAVLEEGARNKENKRGNSLPGGVFGDEVSLKRSDQDDSRECSRLTCGEQVNCRTEQHGFLIGSETGCNELNSNPSTSNARGSLFYTLCDHQMNSRERTHVQAWEENCQSKLPRFETGSEVTFNEVNSNPSTSDARERLPCKSRDHKLNCRERTPVQTPGRNITTKQAYCLSGSEVASNELISYSSTSDARESRFCKSCDHRGNCHGTAHSQESERGNDLRLGVQRCVAETVCQLNTQTNPLEKQDNDDQLEHSDCLSKSAEQNEREEGDRGLGVQPCVAKTVFLSETQNPLRDPDSDDSLESSDCLSKSTEQGTEDDLRLAVGRSLERTAGRSNKHSPQQKPDDHSENSNRLTKSTEQSEREEDRRLGLLRCASNTACQSTTHNPLPNSHDAHSETSARLSKSTEADGRDSIRDSKLRENDPGDGNCRPFKRRRGDNFTQACDSAAGEYGSITNGGRVFNDLPPCRHSNESQGRQLDCFRSATSDATSPRYEGGTLRTDEIPAMSSHSGGNSKTDGSDIISCFPRGLDENFNAASSPVYISHVTSGTTDPTRQRQGFYVETSMASEERQNGAPYSPLVGLSEFLPNLASRGTTPSDRLVAGKDVRTKHESSLHWRFHDCRCLQCACRYSETGSDCRKQECWSWTRKRKLPGCCPTPSSRNFPFPASLAHSGPEPPAAKPPRRNCTCAVMEDHFLHMAEAAYKNIRRTDRSPASFEQFKRELTQTNCILKESVDIVNEIKDLCEHWKESHVVKTRLQS